MAGGRGLPEAQGGPARAAAGAGGGSARARARRLLVLLALVLLATTALSLLENLRAATQRYEEVALATGRSILQQVVLTRRWNAGHGGVYVPVTPETPPNPYLDAAGRDLVAAGGQRLTLLNPAYMTRQISELLQREGGTQLHLTSLRPMRPQNEPDPWERAALQAFERGETERTEVTGSGADERLRYMAALPTGEECLRCHARQGYRAGDVRGGISVSLPYAPFRRGLNGSYRAVIGAHALFLAVGLGLIGVLGRALLARIGELQESLDHVRTLEGLLPICAGCKKIRKAGAEPTEQASWEPIEQYLVDRTDATFTHGLCPACVKQYFGDLSRR